MLHLLKRQWHSVFLFFIIGCVLLLNSPSCSLAVGQAAQNPGEPLVRAFVDLFQESRQETRLEAYFLSVGLPERSEHTRVLRQQLETAVPLERIVILYALAAMTRKSSDIDAFLEEFPTDSKSFCVLMDAEWYLSKTLNTGIANFLRLLAYEPRTSEKALFHLARITYNMENALLNDFSKDKLVSEYINTHKKLLPIDDLSETEFERNTVCDEKMKELMQGTDQISIATVLSMTFRASDNTKQIDKFVNKQTEKDELELIRRVLFLKQCEYKSDFIKMFPKTQQEIENLLRTEKQLYKPAWWTGKGGLVYSLWSAIPAKYEDNGVRKCQPDKDELGKLQAVLQYGKPYMEAYEEFMLQQCLNEGSFRL